ncbi:MAG: S8 family peptidase [Halioglobus sp.]|nr:S8 family peptidase [Halioglobus sp.]
MRALFRGLMASLIISILATGCGGGGGGGENSQDAAPETPVTPPSPQPQPPAQTFSISGTITASSSQAVDSDTNDPTRLAVSNDTVALAQIISNPITLGGYINQPGTGAPGQSRESGDLDDYFQVDLLAGQRVTLLVGDFEQADADLFLYDTQGNLLDFSIDSGELESLLIPEDGTFVVNVFAFRGGTNYILAIGAPSFSAQNVATSYPIVPWEAVVTYKEETQQSSTASKSKKMSRNFGLTQRAGGRGRGRLMAMRRGLVNAQHADQRLARAAIQKSHHIRDPDLRARWETLMTIKSLRADPEVSYADPNYQVKIMATPNDEAFPVQWHYPLIGLPEAWDITTGNPSIVAVIDTGILRGHPDLAGQQVEGYDFVRDPDSAGDGDGIDSNPSDPGESFGGGGESFHGTHVAGTVAARGNNREGVAGTAYSAKIMPLRALGKGGAGTSFDVDQAVRFAAGLPNDSGTVPQQRADVINLSLGGSPFSQTTQALYDEVRAVGVLVVAAAGNQASSTLEYPASYEGVISVSAVDIQRRLASYSNTGPAIDVAAPGGDNSVDINGDGYPDGILSTGGTKTSGGGINYVYSFLNGTSMAAPHVAGVLALMKSVNPDLTPADIDALLSDGQLSDDLGPAGRDDQFGHGIINARRAVLAALEASGTSPADSPRLTASASTLNFGTNGTTLELVLRNGGKGDLTLLSLTASPAWLQIESVNVDGAGLGTYQINVDRADLSPGIYTADINAQSDINNLAVRILMSVGYLNAGADVGVLYILLYDPISDEPVAQFASSGSSSGYPFQFSDIVAGEYEVVAGSDADNDLLICDAGEACGAWLTIDQPIRITLDNDMADLDFPVEFLVSLPNLNSQNQSQSQSSAGKLRAGGEEGQRNIKRLSGN